MASATLLSPYSLEETKFLLPRGINVTGQEPHGSALRLTIDGKDLVKGKSYQLVSTDGPLLRCIELVENDVDEQPQAAGVQERRQYNG